LTAWVGTAENGILHFPTYTYTDMNGNGNANLVKNIQHKNRHFTWHFVWFGYSRVERKARAYVKFLDGEEELVYDNVNHYIPEKLYLYLGHDMPSDTFYSG